MTTFNDLADVLPESTRSAWEVVAELSPASGVLMGGTGVAVHLRHRVSRDLDVFVADPFDVDELEDALARRAPFAVVSKDDETLNGVLGETKVQFLRAGGQTMLQPAVVVEGLPVGSLADLAATKLKAIGDRGALRDYFDLQRIEEQASLRAEEVFGFYLARYGLSADDPSVGHIVSGLGYFDDVGEDPGLPVGRDEIVAFWRRRQPQIAAHLSAHP